MSFILQNYSRASVSFNKDSFADYHYIHPTDTIEEIGVADYFLNQQNSLSINDIIQVKAVDGLVSFRVTAVTPQVTTVIAIQNLDENGDVVFNTVQVKNLNGGGEFVVSSTAFGEEPKLTDIPGLRAVNEGLSTGGSNEASAVIQSVSTDKGWMFPNMTEAQRDAINAPAEGLVIFNTTNDALSVRSGGVWKVISTV